MDDQDRELLKWVAEELGGWVFPGETDSVTRMKAERFAFEKLQSWGGIGLVVEAMEKRGWVLRYLGLDYPNKWVARFGGKGDTGWLGSDKAWFAVYEAARKAVEGKEEPPNACPGHP